jgi:hypothetical protein
MIKQQQQNSIGHVEVQQQTPMQQIQASIIGKSNGRQIVIAPSGSKGTSNEDLTTGVKRDQPIPRKQLLLRRKL